MYIKGSGAVEISRTIERAVREGRLVPGEKLPTVRALAHRLGVSPSTVNAAYKGLRHRGVLTARGRNGTAVSAAPPIAAPVRAAVPAGVVDLASGNPDKVLLPSLARAIRKLDPSPRLYGSDLKSPALLALARKRLAHDGVPVRSLAFTSGALDAIERILQLHLRPGDRVIVEDPAFAGILDLVAALGLEPVPAEVDDAGILPPALERAMSVGAEALIVTPRAQNPRGSAFDTARARALGRILRAQPDLLLIEDDHGAEVCGAPLHTLTAQPRRRWAYTRSVSKSLGPDLRLSVVAGDDETLARLEGRQLVGMRWVSHILQEIVYHLWSDPRVEAQLKAAEKTYAERRSALRSALAARGIEAFGRSGLNLWIPVPDETLVVQALRDSGWAVTPGRRFRIASPPGIRVTVASLARGDAERFATALSEALSPGVAVPPA